MKLCALGGAGEVGGSCYFLEAGGRKFLLDAGIRLTSAAADRLPDLAMLHELGGIDAIIISHAHTDHTGCLPVVCQAFPEVKIYCTQPTKMLMQILFKDAMKIMEGRWEQEAEIPLYDEAAVARMFGRLFPVHYGEKLRPFGDNIELFFYPAGHILGAGSISLFTTEGNVLYTGDFSVTPQRTVNAMPTPPIKPDLVISESTYGNRLHANRQAEEKRLYETVAKIVQGGGKVLIPAFALGRAQEVILILQDAQKKGLIPSFPLWVDGMVKNMCAAYSAFSDELPKKLQQKMSKGENPFFHEGGTAKPVIPPDREDILNGGPCAIISSSGMLTGGPSVFYAAGLARSEKNAIFLTGYQDEESPGRSLLGLIDKREEKFLEISGNKIQVNCVIDRYSLSAHADSGQIMAMISHLSPSDVVLVHGDGDSRGNLGASLVEKIRTYLPDNDEMLEFTYGKPQRRALSRRDESKRGIGEGRELDNEGMKSMREALAGSGSPDALRTPGELAVMWYGDDAPEESLEQARKLLLADNPFFERDRRRPFLLRFKGPQAESSGPKIMEQNAALREVEEIFRGVPDLYRKGTRPEGDEILLFFKFPPVAEVEHAERLKKLEEKTGRSVILSREVHMGAIEEALRDLLPSSTCLVKAPSFFREKNEVGIKISNPEHQNLSGIPGLFQERTGLQLLIRELSEQKVTPEFSFDREGRMEQNAMFSLIDSAFAPYPGILTRKSRKSSGGKDFIELSFISPEVGARYEAMIGELSQKSGWELRINPEPNQNAIKQWVRGNVPPSWGLQKEPGFFKQETVVGLKLSKVPQVEEWGAFSERVLEATGYGIKAL